MACSPNSTADPPPKLGDLGEPWLEVRALWDGRLCASEPWVRSADPAIVAEYGLDIPEVLDMHRAVQFAWFLLAPARRLNFAAREGSMNERPCPCDPGVMGLRTPTIK